VEDRFGLLVVMVVNYATGLLSYKDRRYFLGATVLDGGLGETGVKCDGGCSEII